MLVLLSSGGRGTLTQTVLMTDGTWGLGLKQSGW